jgi:hypothetical protein
MMFLGLIEYDHGWMISRVARRRFMILSVCSLLLGFTMYLMVRETWLFDRAQGQILIETVELIVVIPSIIGGLSMLFGMIWYSLNIDPARKPFRLLRAFLIFFTFPLGQIIYYLLIYRPKTAGLQVNLR